MAFPYSRQDFENRLVEGNKTEQFVVNRLLDAGIDAHRPEVPADMPRSYYSKNQIDIIANNRIIEVKGRTITFEDVQSFPYPDMFIESVSGFKAKVHKPDYYLNVSNPTGGIICLPVQSTFDHWIIKNTTDRKRNFSYDMYLVEKKHFISWEEFLEELRK